METPASHPYCANCKYDLSGLTESSRCPECGRPLVEVLQRPAWKPPANAGRRYSSPVRIFGLPLVQIAIGPWENERIGRARGIIALGDTAIGVFAFGGRCIGVVAAGGLATGILAVGGLAVGVLSYAGIALGLLLGIGGCSVGGVAAGGAALGLIAEGGVAAGLIARGGAVFARHAISAMRRDPEAVALFSRHQWLFGGALAPLGANITLALWAMIAAASVVAGAALVCWLGYLRDRSRQPPGPMP